MQCAPHFHGFLCDFDFYKTFVYKYMSLDSSVRNAKGETILLSNRAVGPSLGNRNLQGNVLDVVFKTKDCTLNRIVHSK